MNYKYITLVLSTSFAAFIGNMAHVSAQPQEMRMFVEKMVPQFMELSKDSKNLDAGLSGLWRARLSDDNASINALYMSFMGPLMLQMSVDTQSGQLQQNNIIGYGRRSGEGWRGWFAISCKACCPGVTWWDKGAVQYRPKDQSMEVRIDTLKLDPQSCEFTQTPDLVVLQSQKIKGFGIGNIAPGKKIHIGAAPAVGSNSAQFQASMKLKWAYDFPGLARLDIAARTKSGGRLLADKTEKMQGTLDYRSSQAGRHGFLVIGYNRNGQPIHYEETAIDVPAIPGLNR